jgi:Zn-dependent peptidase ImmA (M78 family)/transcriptional regulator with XRE-family HTH domain
MKALINKMTLQKICKSIDISSLFLAKKTGCKNLSNVNDWLNPALERVPTFKQAKTIAKKLHIPLAGLYMNPDDVRIRKIPNIKRYRVLPDKYEDDQSALNIAIVDLLNYSNYYISLKSELNEKIIPNLPYIENLNTYIDIANKIRDFFNFDLTYQHNFESSRQFYLYVRKKIEVHDIFIHSFKDVNVEMARGVAIYDIQLPIIGINDKDSYSAKIFSIIHELTHLLRYESACCNEYFDAFTISNEEILCNAVAGEFLVPKNDLFHQINNYLVNGNITYETIDRLSSLYSVSNQVITRRLLDNNIINNNQYKKFIEYIKEQLQQNKEKKKLSKKKIHIRYKNLPLKQAIDRISSNLTLALIKSYEKRLLTEIDISKYLDLSIKHTVKFLKEASK